MQAGRTPRVSVAICLHNGSRFIGETLASVFGQSFQDFEVIVIDDGSTDGGAELIERRFRDSRLRLIRQERQTLAGSRPRALAESRGEFVAFIDQDDLWLPEKLALQIAAARRAPDAALVFSDCLIVDEAGRETGRLSQQYDFASIGLEAGAVELELLRRGSFIAMPTAFVRRAALDAAGGFDRRYQYVEDYAAWLRLARRHRFVCIPRPLAKYRIHAGQFTALHPEIALIEHAALLRPILRTASYPPPVRTAVRDNLFGQYRVTFRAALAQRKWLVLASCAAGMTRFPAGFRDAALHRLAGTPLGRLCRAGRWLTARALRVARRTLRFAAGAGRGAPRPGATDIWFDGTSLGGARTGYFSLVTGLIRDIADRPEQFTLHVLASRQGRTALARAVGTGVRHIRFHRAGWRARHWSEIHRRIVGSAGTRWSGRLIRFCWRTWPAPRLRAPGGPCIEVVVWRGRFRWRDSRRIAIVQDLTTRIHPELHTAGNVAEFEEFLAYAERHATEIATVSASSRRDIIARTGVCADSVWVLPMPVHPQYASPVFDAAVCARHGIRGPYVLSVGTIEPRKNLRRLIRAFEAVKKDAGLSGLSLILAGPPGWDDEFEAFLQARPGGDVAWLGFVPQEDLPSLYHFASAVICASLYEGFGLPVLEAMCCSGIVAGSRVSSVPEVLGEDGVLFDPYHTVSIAAAIRSALTLAPEQAAAYRARCRARAVEYLRRTAGRPFPIR